MNRFLTALKKTIRDRFVANMSLACAGIGTAMIALPIYTHANGWSLHSTISAGMATLGLWGMAVATIVIPTVVELTRRRG